MLSPNLSLSAELKTTFVAFSAFVSVKVLPEPFKLAVDEPIEVAAVSAGLVIYSQAFAEPYQPSVLVAVYFPLTGAKK